ncbi:MAG: hypothetical protein ACK5A2_09280 [Bacteroidota bacterium]|jgi:hypothetical protein
MEVFGKPLGIIIPPKESKRKSVEVFGKPINIKTMPKGCGKPKPKK